MRKFLIIVLTVLAGVIISAIQAVMFLVFWSRCHQLFPALPEVWHNLDWLSIFCLFACVNCVKSILFDKIDLK